MLKKKSRCEHGKQRSQCVDCGGIAICDHGKVHCKCKECGGASICRHGRQRPTCKECGGSQICEHGVTRSNCTKCGGGGICDHGKRRHRCPDCTPTGAFKAYTDNARKRNHQFDLSFKEYLKISDSPCAYCGDRKVRNGVDRKDNTIGYTVKNSVPCCGKCNQMKFKYSVKEFLTHVKRITNFQRSKIKN